MAGQVWRALDVITVNQTDGEKKKGKIVKAEAVYVVCKRI
jgi:hypothetical protein